MYLIRFLASSLSLSFPVFLRMLPILLMTGLVVFAAAYGLIEHPGYLTFVAAVTFFPLMAFLSICAIRAGLVQRRQSRGPELGKLVRKSLLLGGVFAGLGLFYLILQAGAVAATVRPASLAEWMQFAAMVEASALEPGGLYVSIAKSDLPLALALGGAFLIYNLCLIAISVPIAAHGANAAVHGPRHEFFYGVGRKMLPLSMVAILSYVVFYGLPPFLFAVILGSRPFSVETIIASGVAADSNYAIFGFLLASTALYIWLFSWYGAATAVAYIDVRDHIEEEHQIAMGAIRANTGPQTDLAEMMRQRTERLRMPTPVSVLPTGMFDDIDEPIVADPAAEDDLFDDVAGITATPEQPVAEDPLVLQQTPLSTDQIEERFQSRFGNESGSALRVDLSSALREAAEMEAPPSGSEEIDAVDPASLIPAEGEVVLDAELVPPVEPDLHEAVPESDDAPEWLRKYLGHEADKTIFGEDNK